MKNLLEIFNLAVCINENKIINDLNLKIEKGKITVLLGPNGSGKTTTLKVISGLLDYESGKIDSKVLKKDIKIIFDEPILYNELTGLEHIYFYSDLLNIKIDKQQMKYLINSLDLIPHMNKTIETYSLGMKKKITLLMVLLSNPKIILLDEFISGLDPKSLFIIKKILEEYVKKGNSILLATHMLHAVENFCNNVVMLNNGYIIKDSFLTIDEIKLQYNNLEKYYLNFLK